uniref:Transmembrane protein n=1 Tax=Meloidogyne javanica TaxID=6303 RepID=A0A915M3B7_MELJA
MKKEKQRTGLSSQSSFQLNAKEKSEFSNGYVISMHKPWPDLQLNQSKLFFECTLFLYSVLALFLQYLNLYKTLWWLPKSYWHYSLLSVSLDKNIRYWEVVLDRKKYHLINPYLLSCIGLLLGVRVTKCFWDAIELDLAFVSYSEVDFSSISDPSVWLYSEVFLLWANKENTLLAHILLFHNLTLNEFVVSFNSILVKLQSENFSKFLEEFSIFIKKLFSGPQPLLNLESTTHLCSEISARTREEASILFKDFENRCKYCVYTGILTAYFSIFMPRALLPTRTASGFTQYMLIDDIWTLQLFSIIGFTGFSLYVTYLFPISYFDLLYRCVVHLGFWEQIQPPIQQQHISSNSGFGRNLKTTHNFHEVFEEFNPSMVAFEFWLLLLTSDWQQIVTLVLLMFANYLLLAKMFKDRVIIGRIYKPSSEDLQLIKRLQEEMDAKNDVGLKLD